MLQVLKGAVGENLEIPPMRSGRCAPPQVTRFDGSPRTSFSMLSMSWSASVCIASSLAPVTCGVRMSWANGGPSSRGEGLIRAARGAR